MRTSVVVPTYRRAWALPYLLEGLVNQILRPDEVIFVLKPSGDGSEEIIERYRDKLNIKLIIQREGYAPAAYAAGIREASGDIVLFIDDDAVPHPEWTKRYIDLFRELKDAGAIGGLTYKAFIADGTITLSDESLFSQDVTTNAPYRRPLRKLADYCRWLSVSGFPGARLCASGDVIKTVLISGNNMGFRRELIQDLDLTRYYSESRKAFHFEAFMAYYVVNKGYNSYMVLDRGKAPIAWHIESHRDSLTRRSGFWDEFWIHFDRASMYFRLRRLGADLSILAYLLANIAIMRKKTLPRLLATIYAISYNTFLYLLKH
ncbi:glycosyltransferase family 2 protein [Thermoproteus tenax]|uniref:Glycosyltransferase n=1 Tax=Thermoproteus tenax (strain ATCC 35583 / DSM 2078 / JCM 9277 / NBRC 100435 / Kra 1) TaxID=768679 RepID=G4RK68_THETK|nr:glycosyltransferase family 2 protein [Thermoproteus tenax]CCC81963.1 glycosyltransferase [Thermoproteus tenax Kra 1]